MDLLDLVKSQTPLFPHGTRFEYNNSGYILLGMAIEKASGIAYDSFIESRIFAKLGMKDSAFDRPQKAKGFNFDGGVWSEVDPVDASVPWSAGGFRSTPRDMLKWASGITKLLDAKSRAARSRVYPETALQGMHYGYGVVLDSRSGKRLEYHGGGIRGFTSVLQVYPEERLHIIVLSNVEQVPGRTTAWEMGDALAKRVE